MSNKFVHQVFNSLLINVDESRIPGDIVSELIDGINENKELFLGYYVIKLSRGQIITDVIDNLRIMAFLLPQHIPMAVSEA